MKASQHAAISSNQKAFPIFARKLSSRDGKEYATTARKLTTWLGSEKAYYAGARPKIVELLEIALSAFIETFVHQPTVEDFAQVLQDLVQAVVPYIHLFPEMKLQARLQQVIAETQRSTSRVPTSVPHGNVPSQGIATANSSPSLTANVHPQPTIPLIPAPQKPTAQTQLSPSTKVAPDISSVHVDALRVHNPAEEASNQTDANSFIAFPVTNTPQVPGENISPSLPFKPQPKRVRRAEISEELIARDLDWFKANQAAASANKDGASASMASESSPAMPSGASHIPRRSPSPKKTARMVPSRRLPRRISLETVQNAETGAAAFGLPPPSESSVEGPGTLEGVSAQGVYEQPSSLEGVEPGARSAVIPEVRDMQQVAQHEGLPTQEPQPVDASLKHPEIPIPQTNHQPPLVKTPLLNGESRRLSTPLPEAMSDRMESMDISIESSEGVISESPHRPPSTPPQSPEALRLHSPNLPPLVGTWEPSLNLNFSIPRISLQQSAVDANQRRFDEEMIIIYSTQGKTFTHTHVIDISLNEHVFAKISKWGNRRSHPSEAAHGICISLACYRLPGLFDKIKLGGGKAPVEALTLSSCSWPPSNRLSLHVKDGTRQTIITLSPPLFLTPDQSVDVSSLMKFGRTTLEVRQRGDLSEYLVVLHAHRPTRGQLAELDTVKIVDERWKRFLDALSARVVPGTVLGATPAGVVGVF